MKGHIKFKERKSALSGHFEVLVYNLHDEYLGYIEYYKKWRRWIFLPDDGTFYDSECLLKIIEKLGILSQRRKSFLEGIVMVKCTYCGEREATTIHFNPNNLGVNEKGEIDDWDVCDTCDKVIDKQMRWSMEQLLKFKRKELEILK